MKRPLSMGRGALAARTLFVLVALGGCLAAVAYAATAPHAARKTSAAGASGAGTRPAERLARRTWRLPRPWIVKHPETVSTSATAIFAFRAKDRTAQFECSLDGRTWSRCAKRTTYRGLGFGEHTFSVRMVRGRRHGRSSSYRWFLLEPKPFSIEPRVAELGDLFPGSGPVSLPVTIVNPNPVPIFVTALGVAVNADLPGCESAANFEALPSSASAAAPVVVPAGGSVELPSAAASAPALGLRELPFNQDACQGAHVPLLFSGEAHG